jgi:hypothetical protein
MPKQIKDWMPDNVAEIFILPLYTQIPTEHVSKEDYEAIVQNLTSPRKSIDVFCPNCQSASIFTHLNSRDNPPNISQPSSCFSIKFNCSRDTSHELLFFFKVEEDKIIKVGQFPSYMDLYDIKKYQSVLSKEDSRELYSAIGLRAHGDAVASFLYLRRIFERLLKEAVSRAKDKGSLTENIDNKKVVEKIKLLKGFLPEFMVENHSIYSILSKGIHELGNKECDEYFDTVKLGIEAILEEEMSRKDKEKRNQEIAKAISKLNTSLK